MISRLENRQKNVEIFKIFLQVIFQKCERTGKIPVHSANLEKSTLADLISIGYRIPFVSTFGGTARRGARRCPLRKWRHSWRLATLARYLVFFQAVRRSAPRHGRVRRAEVHFSSALYPLPHRITCATRTNHRMFRRLGIDLLRRKDFFFFALSKRECCL